MEELALPVSSLPLGLAEALDTRFNIVASRRVLVIMSRCFPDVFGRYEAVEDNTGQAHGGRIGGC